MQHPATVSLFPCDGPLLGPCAMPWCPHAQSRGRLHFLHELFPQMPAPPWPPRPKEDTGPLWWDPAVLVGRRWEGWSRALSSPGGCAGGCCADTLLRRHVLVLEPGEGLQPAGLLLPALPGSVPGHVSACTVVAKLTPCAQRGAGAGCSLQYKGIGSPHELPGAVGGRPGGTPAGKPCSARAMCWGTAKAFPLLRAPGAAEA